MSPAESAADRLNRVLAILAWVRPKGGATFEEIAERFGVPAAKVEKDLQLVWMCGRYPYTYDVGIGIDVTEDGISVDESELAARPLQLTAEEGAVVHAAATTLLGIDPEGADSPLGRAVTKLEALLGDALVVDPEQVPHLDALRRAATEHRVVEVEYYSKWRDVVSHRRIEPAVVSQRDGRWYVEAHDSESQELRRFRVSRIHSLTETDDTFEPRTVTVGDTFTPGAEAEQVELWLPGDAAWVLEAYPVVEHEPEGDGHRVVLTVAGRPWLEQLLLRVGASAEVRGPEGWQTVGADAAQRVLARYQAG